MDLHNQLIENFIPSCIEPDFGTNLLVNYKKQSAVSITPDWSSYALECDLKLNSSNYGQRFKFKYFDKLKD